VAKLGGRVRPWTGRLTDSRNGGEAASILTRNQQRLYCSGELAYLPLNRKAIEKPGQMCYNGISKGCYQVLEHQSLDLVWTKPVPPTRVSPPIATRRKLSWGRVSAFSPRGISSAPR
jgi:hypothetical protein